MESLNVPDKRYDPRSAGKQPRKYKFVGEHPELETGAFYTLREISNLTGVNNKTMHSRMVGKGEVASKQVRETMDPFGGRSKPREAAYDRLNNEELKVSDKWLRVKL